MSVLASANVLAIASVEFSSTFLCNHHDVSYPIGFAQEPSPKPNSPKPNSPQRRVKVKLQHLITVCSRSI